MLNLQGNTRIERSGSIPLLLDNSTQVELQGVWDKPRAIPTASMSLSPYQITITDGKGVLIHTKEIGLIYTSEINISVVTTKEGFLIQLNSGIMMVRKGGVEYLVSSEGLFTKNFDTHPVRWIDLERYYNIFAIQIKSRYQLVKTPPKVYMDNLAMTIVMLENAMFNTRILDISERVGLDGGFQFLNEQQMIKEQQDKERQLRQERLKHLEGVRQRELQEKAERKAQEIKGKKSKTGTKKKEEQPVNSWRSQLLGK